MEKVISFSNSVGAVSPAREMGAYEALWEMPATTFRAIASLLRSRPESTLSQLVDDVDRIEAAYKKAMNILNSASINDFGVRLSGTLNYPTSLRDAEHPLEFLYFRGFWDILDAPKRIAVVGTRNPTEEGVRRTRKLVKSLVERDYTIVSGLAKGIDTAAHRAAIEFGGATVAVLGTSIAKCYPADNKELQENIAKNYLLISQVPVLRYAKQTPLVNRLFFPERNITMSALTQATIIVEAGETSGTLIQARAALKQKRKLFILDSCFRKGLTWPAKMQELGAVRVTDFEDIEAALEYNPI